jgi:deoxyribonuclease V
LLRGSAGSGGGMCAAVDVHYPSTGGARAAAVLAADAAFAHVLAERIAMVPRVAPYRPGEFYLRELPPLRAVLEDLNELGLLMVDGYADLDPGGRPGLGARAHAEFGIPVIGVAKSTHGYPRGAGRARILGTPVVRHLLRMPTADAADVGWRMVGQYRLPRRTAPRRYPRADRSARSHNDRPPARLTYAAARNAQKRILNRSVAA